MMLGLMFMSSISMAETFCMTDARGIKNCSDGNVYDAQGRKLVNDSPVPLSAKKAREIDNNLICTQTYNQSTKRMENQCRAANCSQSFEDGQWGKYCN